MKVLKRCSKFAPFLCMLLLCSMVAANGSYRKVSQATAPVYPAKAKRDGKIGKVLIKVTVAPDGTVSTAKVVSGDPLLSQVSLTAAKNWKFEESTKDSEDITLTFNFWLVNRDNTETETYIAPYRLDITRRGGLQVL